MNYPLIYLLNETYETLATFSNELPNALPVVSDFYEGNMDDNSFIVEITTILTHPRACEIKVGRHIYYPTTDSGKKKLFRIIEIVEDRAETYTLTLKAELTVVGDLLEQVVRPTSFTGASVEEIMKIFLTNTNWNVVVKDYFPSLDYEVGEYTTSLEAVRSFAETIGANVDYSYVYNGLTIVNRDIILYKQDIEDVSLYVSKERDLQSIKRIIDTSNMITSIVGVGGNDSKGQKVTLASLGETARIPGEFLHEYGSDYLDYVESVKNSPVKKYGILTDSECKTPEQLLEKCMVKLKEFATPIIKYEVNFSLLSDTSRIALGKKVFVNDMTVEPKIALSGSIRQIKTSIYNSSENSIVLGNYIAYDTTLDDTIKDLQDRLEVEEDKNNRNSYSVRINSTGGYAFVNGEGETTLSIEVYKGGLEIDTDGEEYEYTWRRYSDTGEPIPIVGLGGETMEINQKKIKILGNTVAEAKKINLKGTVLIKEY